MASNSGSGYQSGTSAAPQKGRAVLKTVVAQQRGSFNDSALLTVGTGNAGVRYTSVAQSLAGNAITVAHVVAGNNTALSVAVAGNAITVNLATNGGGVATSTAAQVVAAVNGSGPASALVTAAPVGDGTGTAVAIAATNLAGGKSMITAADGNAPFPKIPPIHNRYNGQSTGTGSGGPGQGQSTINGGLSVGYN